MTVTILEIKQNSPEWEQERKGKVTGSIADTLLNRGLDEALKANNHDFKGNYYTQRGHILEDEAIELYEQIYNTIVDRPGFVKNSKFNNAACSPDGIDRGVYLIEVKAFNEMKHLAIKNAGALPFKIKCQLQFNMMICEIDKARLVMYNPDVESDELAFKVIEVRADKNIHKNMAEHLKRTGKGF